MVDEVPDTAVRTIAADQFQPRTWYAGSGSTLFRSLNDGEGWEPVARFAGEDIRRVRVHPGRPGVIAVATLLPDGGGSRLHVSEDTGETWDPDEPTLAFEIEDIAWMTRDGIPVVLMACDVGLYELPRSPGATPLQVLVTPEDQDRGFYAVAVAVDAVGGVNVAVAAQAAGGVYLSSRGAERDTFRPIGLAGDDVRVLAIQRDGPRSFLWAGVAAAGAEAPGKGCFRWDLLGDADSPTGWQPFGRNWDAGSCWGLAFMGTLVMAATHHAGVLRLDASRSDAAWQPLDINAGLPLRDPGPFLFTQVDDVAADPNVTYAMAAGQQGVYRSDDEGVSYRSVSSKEFPTRDFEMVTLPPTWLFASGEHEITVVGEQEARRR